jgi:hypothetical protein
MMPEALSAVRAVKGCEPGSRVTFRAQVLRCWETGGLKMCLVGDVTGLTRVDLGGRRCEQGASYEFRDAVVRAYPGGWHSVALEEGSELLRLDQEVAVSQDEEYIERTYKILSGVQRKQARKEGRLPAWRHPAAAGDHEEER